MCVFNASVSCISLPVVAIIFVCTVFCSASLSCHNFIGHNIMFGKSFVQDYSGISLQSVNLVGELRQLTFCTRFSDLRTDNYEGSAGIISSYTVSVSTLVCVLTL